MEEIFHQRMMRQSPRNRQSGDRRRLILCDPSLRDKLIRQQQQERERLASLSCLQSSDAAASASDDAITSQQRQINNSLFERRMAGFSSTSTNSTQSMLSGSSRRFEGENRCYQFSNSNTNSEDNENNNKDCFWRVPVRDQEDEGQKQNCRSRSLLLSHHSSSSCGERRRKEIQTEVSSDDALVISKTSVLSTLGKNTSNIRLIDSSSFSNTTTRERSPSPSPPPRRTLPAIMTKKQETRSTIRETEEEDKNDNDDDDSIDHIRRMRQQGIEDAIDRCRSSSCGRSSAFTSSLWCVFSSSAGRRRKNNTKLLLERLGLTSMNDLPIKEIFATPMKSTLLKLSLSGNPLLRCIPNQIVQDLHVLRHLDLSDCGLTDLPTTDWDLPKLVTLDLKYNRLSMFPGEWVWKGLPELRELDLYGNRISQVSLPRNSQALFKNLRTLDLGHNDLLEFPVTLCHQLHSLRSLRVAENYLSVIPFAVCKMRSLKTIEVFGNPLSQPPLEGCQRGLSAIRFYWLAHELVQSSHRGSKNSAAAAAVSIREAMPKSSSSPRWNFFRKLFNGDTPQDHIEDTQFSFISEVSVEAVEPTRVSSVPLGRLPVVVERQNQL